VRFNKLGMIIKALHIKIESGNCSTFYMIKALPPKLTETSNFGHRQITR